MLTTNLNNLLYILTIAGQIFVILGVIYLFFFRNSQKFIFQKVHGTLVNFLTKNAIFLAFVVALVAMSGSLYYSEIAGYRPCDLCWFQRIFMYPQVFLLGLAWLKKQNYIIDYSLFLIGIGTIISIYHNYIYYSAQTSSFCSITTPCTQSFLTGYGYITIPLMSLTAFLMIAVLLINKRLKLS